MTRLHPPWMIGLALYLAAAVALSDAVEVSDLESLRLNMADDSVSSIELVQSLVLSSPLPVVTRELTIIGNCSDSRAPQCVLQCNSTGGAFVADAGARLTLANLVVLNGIRKENAPLPGGGLDPGRGAAVYMKGGGFLNVVNCEFSNHNASVEGGAFYLDNITAVITGTNFSACTAGATGQGQRGTGGAISANRGSLTITRCNFIRNTLCSSCAGGGALGMTTMQVTIADSYFYLNKGGNQGADGFFQAGSLTVDRSEFASGSCQRGGSFSFFDVQTVIRDSYFHHANVSVQGGSLNLFANTNNTLLIERCNFSDGWSGSQSAFMESLGYLTTIRDSSIRNMTSVAASGSIQLARGLLVMDGVSVNGSYTENGGGFISVRDSLATVHISNSRVSNCRVNNIYGGFMWNVGGSIYVKDTEFSDCTAKREGGLVFGEAPGNGVQVYDMRRVRISNCKAGLDGGVFSVSVGATVTMVDVDIRDVYAARTGGVMYTAQDCTVIMTNVTVNGSSAVLGGAIYMGVRSNLYISGGLFQGILAEVSGALYMGRRSNATLTDVTIMNATALGEGGAISFEGAKLVMNGGLIKYMLAFRHGGAMLIQEGSEVWLNGTTIEDAVTKESGGAIMNRGLLTVTHSTFRRCSAYAGGGGIFSTGHLLDVRHSRFEMCESMDAAGGAISTRDASCGDGDSAIVNCTFENNVARSAQGGAIYIDEPEGLQDSCPTPLPSPLLLADSNFTSNVAILGGAIFIISSTCEDAEVDRCVNISSSVFSGNTATSGAGGAIWSYGRLPITCLGGGNVDVSSASCEDWTKNKQAPKSYGPAQATPARALLARNGNYSKHASGKVLPNLKVDIVDAWSQTVVGVDADHYRIIASSAVTSGKYEIRAVDGVAEFTDITVVAMPGVYEVRFSTLDDPLVTDAVIYVQVRPCIVGELDPPGGICYPCDGAEFMSWNTSRPVCDRCPEGASCAKMARVVPLPGYWHSGPYVYQFHECFNAESCDFENRTEFLFDRMDEYNELNEYERAGKYNRGLGFWDPDMQCARGHHGPLCAACNDGYGPDPKGTQLCLKCDSKHKLGGFMVVVVIIHVLLVGFTIKTAAGTFNSDSPAFVDLTKIFITYMQVVAIVSSVDADWPAVVTFILNIFGSIAGTGTNTVSFDCLFSEDGLPRAYDVSIAFFILPFVCIAIGTIYWLIWSPFSKRIDAKRQAKGLEIEVPKDSPLLHWKLWFERRLYMTAIVILFVISPGIAEKMLVLFACFHVDGTDEKDPYQGNILTFSKFWQADMDEQCYQGRHLGVALGIGIPGCLLHVLAVPLGIIALLRYYKRTLSPEDMDTRWGFLFAGFRPEVYYWEAVVMLEKQLLVVIQVFFVTWGSHAQIMASVTLCLIFGIMQFHVAPYKDERMNKFALNSWWAIVLTLYCGLWYFSEELSPQLEKVVTAIFVTHIIAFTLYFLIFFAVEMRHIAMQVLRKDAEKDFGADDIRDTIFEVFGPVLGFVFVVMDYCVRVVKLLWKKKKKRDVTREQSRALESQSSREMLALNGSDRSTQPEGEPPASPPKRENGLSTEPTHL